MTGVVWDLPARLFRCSQPTGECRVTWWNDSATGERVIRLDAADEDIQIAGDLLRDLQEQGWAGEGLFMVKGYNATARYALREYDLLTDVWTAKRLGPDPLAS